MVELEKGIRRVTFPLPFGLDHVHCYLLATSGGYTLVDTGLGSRDPDARWRPIIDALDRPLERIVVTHMHPDHVGGARDVAALTGAPVAQGREDFAQCREAWGPGRSPERFAAHWRTNGMPASEVESVVGDTSWLRRCDSLGRVAAAARCRGRDRRLACRGASRSRRRSHRPRSRRRPDRRRHDPRRDHADDRPLSRTRAPIRSADYFETLDRIEQLAPRVAYTGHKDVIVDPAAPGAGDPRTPRRSGSMRRSRRSTATRGPPTRCLTSSSRKTLSPAERRFARRGVAGPPRAARRERARRCAQTADTCAPDPIPSRA